MTRGALIDGVALARKVRERVADETAALKARGVTPGLTVVLVGDDPASAVYVRYACGFGASSLRSATACSSCGCASFVLPASR